MTIIGRRRALTAVPALLRRAVRFELGLWRSLYRWVLRRPQRLDPGARAFGYSAAPAPVIWTFIVLTAIEIPAVDLLLPWRSVRLAALVLGIQGLLWMVGFLASLKVHPHIVSAVGLRVRYGGTVDVPLPWSAVAAVATRRRTLDERRTIQFDRSDSGTALTIAVLNQTNIDVTLRHPMSVPLPNGVSEPVTELRCYADDPGAFVARAQTHLVDAAPKPPD